MAASKPSTAKKKPATKPVAKKTTTARKTTTAKAATTKKPATQKAPAKRTKQQELRSFRLSRDTQNFISSRITIQTVYWAIFAAAVLAAGVWVIFIQLDILETLNQISQGL